MVVDRLEVDLAGVHEVTVAERRPEAGKHLAHHEADRVLDEARLQMRMLDDEQLVRPLQQRVDRRAHRALHHLDELFAPQPGIRSDHERPAAALVVGGERDELEDALDVAPVEARLLETPGGPLADEPLRARARVDAGGLDADGAPRSGR